MEQSLEIARALRESPDLFPWVCLALVLVLVVKERGTIRSYVNARISAYDAKKQSDAVMAELVRNNTAALDNNTAALEAVKNDRGSTRKLVEHHESASAERMAHIQEVVNRIDTTVTANSKSITIIEDRTDERR